VLSYATYMAYAACLAVVRPAWGVSAAQAALVSTAFNLAYAASLVVCSTLADRAGARRVALWSAWSSAIAALLFGLFARSFTSTLLLFTLVGLTQGGLYNPLLMLMAQRYAPAERGRAVGWLISSTSVGYAVSLLGAGVALSRGGYPLAFLVTGTLPSLGALVLWWTLRHTPNQVRHAPAFHHGSVTTAARRETRLLVAGYTAHSWELLGMWTWMPAFLTAALAGASGRGLDMAGRGAYLGAGLHLLGALAAATMGHLSDVAGRRRTLTALAALGTILSGTMGWTITWPVGSILGVALIYSFVALGDSPVLSTALTEVVGPGGLGRILAVRSLLGFGAGAIAPWVFGLVLDALNPGLAVPVSWGWAFCVLGLGGAVATVCAWQLGRPPGPSPR
jgi:MFS family permease